MDETLNPNKYEEDKRNIGLNSFLKTI